MVIKLIVIEEDIRIVFISYKMSKKIAYIKNFKRLQFKKKAIQFKGLKIGICSNA